jgi:hypothetical protein
MDQLRSDVKMIGMVGSIEMMQNHRKNIGKPTEKT